MRSPKMKSFNGLQSTSQLTQLELCYNYKNIKGSSSHDFYFITAAIVFMRKDGEVSIRLKGRNRHRNTG